MPFKRSTVTRPTGLVTDLSPYELPNEVWTDARNGDFNSKRSSTSKGWTHIYEATSNATFAIPWTDFNMPYWFVCQGTKIYRMQYDNVKEVTRTTGDYQSETYWTGSGFNGAVVLNNGVDAPQYYNMASSYMADLLAWPKYYTAEVVRPFKNYLIALDITKDTGQRYPVMVKWSDPADAGGVPLSWDETSPETQAGESLLPDTSGRAVDALALNDNFIIYKADSVWSMTFTGGPLVFSFRRIFADDGMMARDCVVEVEGRHYVIGTNDIYAHDGTRKQSIVDSVTRKAIFDSFDEDREQDIKMVAHPPTSEIWIYQRNTGTTWVYNWEQQVWCKRDMPIDIQYMHLGAVDTTPSEWWDEASSNWDGTDIPWGQQEYGASNVDLVGVTPTGLHWFQQGYTRGSIYSELPYTTTFERIGINFGDDHQVKYVHSITPHILGTGTVMVQVGGEMVQGEGVHWETAVPFAIDAQKKCDFRHTSRYLAVRFYAESDETQFDLTGYTIEFEETGQR